MEIIIINRLDHYITYKKLVKKNFISDNNKIIIIKSNHKIENKISNEDQKKIIDIMETPLLPFCKNPVLIFKRLKNLKNQLKKTKNIILKFNPTKIIGVTDSIYSISLLSFFELKNYKVEFIENDLSTYEHESDYGTKGQISLRILYANLILKFSRELSHIKAIDYKYEILFKIIKSPIKKRNLYTNFKLNCITGYNPILIEDIKPLQFKISDIKEIHKIYFFSQPFYLLNICSIKDYLYFVKIIFSQFKENKIYIVPHPSDNTVFLNLLKKNLQSNINLIEKNNNLSNEDRFLKKNNCIFTSINSSILLHAKPKKTSGVIYLNKIFMKYFKSSEHLFSFFNNFCEENNFLNPSEKELMTSINNDLL